MFFIKVVFPIPVDCIFNYCLPINTHVVLGSRIIAPFKNQKKIGIIVKIYKKKNYKEHNFKTIFAVIDKKTLFPASLWNTLLWSAKYYHIPLGMMLFYSLPNILKKGKSTAYCIKILFKKKWSITKLGYEIDINILNRFPKQKKALILLRNNDIYKKELKNINNIIFKKLLLKKLCSLKNILYCTTKKNNHNYFISNNELPKLDYIQIYILNLILKKKENFICWLLTDILELKKFEIYINILQNLFLHKKQILFMVPEINLIKKFFYFFKKFFHISIDIFHSDLNEKEKLKIWIKTYNGENIILIGTRSALFMPFTNLGMIIIEEEHDDIYKEKKNIKYQARDLAIVRAKKENIPIILFSNSPSLESLLNVKKEKYSILNFYKIQKYNIKKKINSYIEDIRGKKLISGISWDLIKKIKQQIEKKNKILIFLNKKGFSKKIFCHDCGWTSKCKKCDNYHTFYKEKKILICLYCNEMIKVFSECYKCNSQNILLEGIGIEQVANKLKILFPNILITKIDSNNINIKNKNSFLDNTQIIISTHMLHYEEFYSKNITLCILMNIDNIIFSFNFRAFLKFGQFYTTLINKIKKFKKVEIFVQTYYPYYQPLQKLIYYNYNIFSKIMLHERKKNSFPPFSQHIMFLVKDKNKNIGIDFLNIIKNYIEFIFYKDKLLSIIGPMPANILKFQNYYRWKLILQHTSKITLYYIIKKILKFIKKFLKSKKVKCIVDVDPIEY